MDEFMGIPIGWLIGFRGIQWGTVVDWMLRLVRHPKNGGKTSRSRERPGRSINPSDFVTGWGPQSIAFRNALFQWLNSMVYGRYNKLVFMGIMMVYKSTYKPLEMVKMAH
jgi:hypothetical protein